MEDSNLTPNSISHKKLQSFLLDSIKEADSFQTKNDDHSKKEEFNQLINSWSILSQELLNELSRKGSHITEDKSKASIMALGAMEVHLKMAIQAFHASHIED
tara:strand:- start:205 stop:510 length:306 start_codon:yes stop_codon:yes gene_type:complete